jgi:methionyl-tRNA synthetase
VIAFLLQPFMPETMSKLLDQLGVDARLRQVADLAPLMAEGTALPPPVGIFPRHAGAA